MNAVPILVDVDPKTLCIDPQKIAGVITANMRASIPMHLNHRQGIDPSQWELPVANDIWKYKAVLTPWRISKPMRWKRSMATARSYGRFGRMSKRIVMGFYQSILLNVTLTR